MKRLCLNTLLYIFMLLVIITNGCKKTDDSSSPTSPIADTPVQTNFWKPFTIQAGVNSATVDPSGNIWAACGDGVYKSSDNGTTWSKINNGLTMTKAVLIKSSNSGIVYSAAGTDLFAFINNTWIDIAKKMNTSLITFDHLYTFSLDKDGNIYAACFISEKIDLATIAVDKPALMKSSDLGQTWTKIKVTQNDGQIKDISFDSKGNIYLIMNATVYHSTDGGKTFTKALSGLVPANPFVLSVNSSNNVFTGTGNGLFFSSDTGTNWSNANWATYCISVGINSKDIVFVGAINRCWKSTNNGAGWTDVSSGLSYSLGGFSDCVIQTFDKNGYIYSILESVLYRSANTTIQ